MHKIRSPFCTVFVFRQDHEESEFECHEVYAVDCLVSSGDGRPKDYDTRTTIYKRNPDFVYQLKMKTSRGELCFIIKLQKYHYCIRTVLLVIFRTTLQFTGNAIINKN